MKSKIRKIFVFFAFALCCLFCLQSTTPVYCAVDTDGVSYTKVLDDLEKDERFYVNDYVVNMEDYSLQVIQVAESSNKELFVYVFQPCSPNYDLQATSINISLNINGQLSFVNYPLILIDSEGCFYKYKVRNLQVAETETRVYEISSIFRAWNENYDTDTAPLSENTIEEVAFAVAKKYTLTTTQGGVQLTCADIETIQITDKFVGFVRYPAGFSWWPQSCDSHFVAFSTNKRIDQLIEADVYYEQQSFSDFPITYGPIQSAQTTVNYTEKVEYDNVQNIFGLAHYYRWDRVATASDFLANVESNENLYACGIFNVETSVQMTTSVREEIASKDWVLSFAETSWQQIPHTLAHGYYISEHKTIVSNVSILRLAFETDGQYYNLGVIDNKQSGDVEPAIEVVQELQFADWFKTLLALILVVFLLIILWPILPTIFSIIFKILKLLFKLLIGIIKLPFKLVKFIFKKRE